MRIPALLTLSLLTAMGTTKSIANTLASPPTATKIMESFEDGVPAHIHSSGGTLSVNHDRMKHGHQSLRWDWQGNATLVYDGHLGYRKQQPMKPGDDPEALMSRADPNQGALEPPRAFFAWIYNDKPRQQRLRIQFGRGDQVDCEFDYNLNFKGWRTIVVGYDRGDMRGTPHPDMDRMTINAPNTGSGTFYLDMLGTSVPSNPRTVNANPQLPEIDRHPRLVAQYPHLLFELSKQTPTFNLYPVDEPSLRDIRTLEQRVESIWLPQALRDSWTPSRIDAIRKQFAKFEIRREGTEIYGRPLMNKNVFGDHFSEIGLSQDEWRKGIQTWRWDFNAILLRIARARHFSEDEAVRQELEQMFIDLFDYGVDQGFAEGAGLGWIHHYSYVIREYAPSLFLMRDVLKEHGRLDEAIATAKYLHGFNRVYREDVVMDVPGRIAANADDLQGLLTQRLICALLMDDSPEKLRDLQHYSSYLSNISTGYANALDETFKPDGSTFHHAGHAFGYGGRALYSTVRTLYILRGTTFAASEDAVARIHKCLEAYEQSLFAEKLAAPKAFATIRFSNYQMPRNFADMVDMMDAVSATPVIKGRDYKGFRMMSYNSVGYARNENKWMTTVRGHGKYVYPYESWGTQFFAYPLFIANGYLDVSYPGSLDSLTPEEGTWHPGLDWRRYPGTTAVHLDYDQIICRLSQVRDEGGEYLFSDQPFVGGVESSFGTGIFTFPFRGHDKYGLESFAGKKTYFFLDNMVVSLGTGITSDISGYPVETALFQNALSEERGPVVLNGQAVTVYPYQTDLPVQQPNWLIDARGTGFWVPENNSENTLHLSLADQENPGPHGKKTTSGRFATAWINHGEAPKAAGYQFVMLADTDPQAMEQFSQGMASEAPPVLTLQADEDAHVVSFPQAQDTAYAVYATDGSTFDQGLVRHVNKQATLITKAEGDLLRLALADPDLNIYDGQEDRLPGGSRIELSVYEREWFFWPSRPNTVRVTLQGLWEIQSLEKPMETLSKQPRVVLSENGKTVIEFVCRDGLSAEVILAPKN
ncbi:MAG: chondroitinase family polysaccharide lyase [Planctomycetota bacterium]